MHLSPAKRTQKYMMASVPSPWTVATAAVVVAVVYFTAATPELLIWYAGIAAGFSVAYAFAIRVTPRARGPLTGFDAFVVVTSPAAMLALTFTTGAALRWALHA